MGQIRLGQATAVHPRQERPPVWATGSLPQPVGVGQLPGEQFAPDFSQVLAPPPAPEPGFEWIFEDAKIVGARQSATGEGYRYVFDSSGRIIGQASISVRALNWLDQETVPGVPNKWLLAGGAGFLFLIALRGKRRR